MRQDDTDDYNINFGVQRSWRWLGVRTDAKFCVQTHGKAPDAAPLTSRGCFSLNWMCRRASRFAKNPLRRFELSRVARLKLISEKEREKLRDVINLSNRALISSQ